jgi:hypothetical protein
LAYKQWSLTIAEDRWQPAILGVTFGVTEDAQMELPPQNRGLVRGKWREKRM